SNHNLARITFSDNGYGIKKEMLEIIFAPFTTTKASTEGTGMGLYNAKSIIIKHKGRIWAESEGPGKGATFVIELPIANDVKPEKPEDSNKGKRLF
ncbi:MAG: HAMP domain-containing sensor histidine kinase, partial [Candidatus Omnitrophota bacterium]